MDVLGVRIDEIPVPASLADAGGVPVRSVHFLVNGRDLVELAREAERAGAAADGQPDLAGPYGGLEPEDALAPSRHLLGAPLPHLAATGDGRVPLLLWECGEAGCWPLVARVEVTRERVTWSDFAQPHRPHWRHHALGPFTFDRAQYEAALGFGHASSAERDV